MRPTRLSPSYLQLAFGFAAVLLLSGIASAQTTIAPAAPQGTTMTTASGTTITTVPAPATTTTVTSGAPAESPPPQATVPAPAQNTLMAQRVAPAQRVGGNVAVVPQAQIAPQQNQAPLQNIGQGTPAAAMPTQQMLQPIDTSATSAATAVAAAPATAATAQTAAPAPAGATEATSPATTQSFAPAIPGNAIPTNTGLISNTGIDMSLNPNMVGGFDPNAPAPANGVPGIPYEVQLEQRLREIQQQARSQAYDQAKSSILPLEGYEIREVLGRLKDTQESIQTPVRPAPEPENVIKTVSLDPSMTPPTIQLYAGNVTTLNIVDMTGEPWPIVDIGFGGPFDIKPPEAGGHVIRITPLKDFANGNLSLRLLKLTTPLTFSLKAGGDTVHYRYDARIPDYGPNAKMPLIDDGNKAVAGDKVMTTMLEGVPPKGADKLTVNGVDGRTSAYRFAGTLYVRTPLSLLSPAWSSSATSADGLNVYAMAEAPVLLLSDRGTLVRARLSDAKPSME